MTKNIKKKPETILCLCAHNDDQVIGAGGTLAKYAKQGKEVYTYIFSYGESSHPHLQREVIVKKRVSESHATDRILDGKEIYHFGLKEGSFLKEIEERGFKEKIKNIIMEKNPSKIFTHSQDDPHPDHRAVNKIIREIIDKTNQTAELYSFDVWNPLTARGRDRPMLVVDISDTFHLKIKALKAHKSQKLTLLTMIPATYARAIINGLNNHCRYAEIFYKIN
ncbi:MAG: PIG-L deacetylase family protein [Candidatus Woesearchaeota archaeon]